MRIPEGFEPEADSLNNNPDAPNPEPEKEPVPQEWVLPEQFQLGEGLFEEADLDEEGTVELFRFFPDGGASGNRRFELHYRTLKRIFEISPLTGRLTVREGTEEEE